MKNNNDQFKGYWITGQLPNQPCWLWILTYDNCIEMGRYINGKFYIHKDTTIEYIPFCDIKSWYLIEEFDLKDLYCGACDKCNGNQYGAICMMHFKKE